MQEKRRRSEGKETVYRRQAAYGWLYSLVVTFAVVCLLFLVWFFPVRIAGDTMAPLLLSDEVVLIDRLGKYVIRPKRGDIVMFTDGAGEMCVKRVVGLPGEQVEIVNGQVFIDSCPLDESMYTDGGGADMAPVLVPEDAVFLLGDNRALVYDSRTPEIGCVGYVDLDGVLRFRISPIRKFTLFY